MKKKWIIQGEETTATTDKYIYIMGLYNHEKYGDNCFRVAKYLKENKYFIGHFVIVPEDMLHVGSTIVNVIKENIECNDSPFC